MSVKGDYFPVSICPSKVYMLDAIKIEGKDQELINVQNNIATSRKEDPPRGFEMIMDKMNIKYDDRQNKMNDKCYKPSASSARRTASATRLVQAKCSIKARRTPSATSKSFNPK